MSLAVVSLHLVLKPRDVLDSELHKSLHILHFDFSPHVCTHLKRQVGISVLVPW
jgi:hypothetical protein